MRSGARDQKVPVTSRNCSAAKAAVKSSVRRRAKHCNYPQAAAPRGLFWAVLTVQAQRRTFREDRRDCQKNRSRILSGSNLETLAGPFHPRIFQVPPPGPAINIVKGLLFIFITSEIISFP